MVDGAGRRWTGVRRGRVEDLRTRPSWEPLVARSRTLTEKTHPDKASRVPGKAIALQRGCKRSSGCTWRHGRPERGREGGVGCARAGRQPGDSPPVQLSCQSSDPRHRAGPDNRQPSTGQRQRQRLLGSTCRSNAANFAPRADTPATAC